MRNQLILISRKATIMLGIIFFSCSIVFPFCRFTHVVLSNIPIDPLPPAPYYCWSILGRDFPNGVYSTYPPFQDSWFREYWFSFSDLSGVTGLLMFMFVAQSLTLTLSIASMLTNQRIFVLVSVILCSFVILSMIRVGMNLAAMFGYNYAAFISEGHSSAVRNDYQPGLWFACLSEIAFVLGFLLMTHESRRERTT